MCTNGYSDPIGNKYVRSTFLSRTELTFKIYIATCLYNSTSVILVKFPFKSFDMYMWVINSPQASAVDHVNYISPHLFQHNILNSRHNITYQM